MLIRREQPDDAEAVATVHQAAFPEVAERDLAIALRVDGHAIPELSLVALIDDVVVGHVVCSTGHADGVPVPGLGPIGVLPEHQGVGVGSALMHAVLGAADALGEPMVVLLGNPDYYGRFGFIASTTVGIEPPEAEWGHFFQSRTLTAHRPDLAGRYAYPEPFDSV